MGWHPSAPEYANFPQTPKKDEGKVIIGHRAHETMRGTRKKPIPNVGTKGPDRPKHYTRLLVANSMALGWLNGKRLPRKGHDGKTA